MRRQKKSFAMQVAKQSVGAEARLLHSQFGGPAQMALATVQQALSIAENLIAKQMAQLDGVDLESGWRLDLDKMEWVKPKE